MAISKCYFKQIPNTKEAKKVSMFSGSTRDNDIAILYLTSSVVSTKFVEPIELSSKDARSTSECVAVGAGNNKNGKEQTRRPQQITLTVLPSADCCSYPHEHQFCVGDTRRGVNDGDSGGPLYCKEKGTWNLYGIIKST